MRPEKFRMLQIFLRVLIALLIGVPFGLWIWGKIPLYYSEIGLYISFLCAVFIETVLCGKYRKTGKKMFKSAIQEWKWTIVALLVLLIGRLMTWIGDSFLY